MKLNKIIDGYQLGISSANECASQIISEVDIREFELLIDTIPEKVMSEITRLAWCDDTDSLFSLHGEAPSKERLKIFRARTISTAPRNLSSSRMLTEQENEQDMD